MDCYLQTNVSPRSETIFLIAALICPQCSGSIGSPLHTQNVTNLIPALYSTFLGHTLTLRYEFQSPTAFLRFTNMCFSLVRIGKESRIKIYSASISGLSVSRSIKLDGKEPHLLFTN